MRVIQVRKNNRDYGHGLQQAIQNLVAGNIAMSRQSERSSQNLLRMGMLGQQIQEGKLEREERAKNRAGRAAMMQALQGGAKLGTDDFLQQIIPHMGNAPNLGMQLMGMNNSAEDRAYQRSRQAAQDARANAQFARQNMPKVVTIKTPDGYDMTVQQNADGSFSPFDFNKLLGGLGGGQVLPTTPQTQGQGVPQVNFTPTFEGAGALQEQAPAPTAQPTVEGLIQGALNMPQGQAQPQELRMGVVYDPRTGQARPDLPAVGKGSQVEMDIDGKTYKGQLSGNGYFIPQTEVTMPPSERKAEKELKAAEKRDALTYRSAKLVTDAIDQAADLVTQGNLGGLVGNTGFGSYLNFLPATTGKDLESTLQTIKANIGFDRLQQMREASPTGGALGAVSERELTYLQSTLANLDTSQSQEQFLRNLEVVKQVYGDIMRKFSAYPQANGGTSPQQGHVIRYDNQGNRVQ